ncbi:hypothetical protein JCM16303_007168 [Sporobolomyces ruberrimus]
MAATPLLALDPNHSLSHLGYSCVQAEIATGVKQEDMELEEILSALSAIYDALARFLCAKIDEIHRIELSLLDKTCSQLRIREEEQALVKSNLRTFLANITTAFQAFFEGAALPTASSSSTVSASAHPLLSINVADDLTPVNRDDLKSQIEAEHVSDEVKLGGRSLEAMSSGVVPALALISIGLERRFSAILKELHELFREFSVHAVSRKEKFDSICAEQTSNFEEKHRSREASNGKFTIRGIRDDLAMEWTLT